MAEPPLIGLIAKIAHILCNDLASTVIFDTNWKIVVFV